MIISTVEFCGHRSRGALLQERKLKLVRLFFCIYSKAGFGLPRQGPSACNKLNPIGHPATLVQARKGQ